MAEEFQTKREDFRIDNSSVFALEKELKRYSELVYDYGKAWASAIKEEQQAELAVDIVSATLVREYASKQKKDVSPYAMSEIRRSVIPDDIRYIEVRNALIDKTEASNILKGAYYAIVYKNERLKECFRVALRDLIGDDQSVIRHKQTKQAQMQDNLNNTEIDSGL